MSEFVEDPESLSGNDLVDEPEEPETEKPEPGEDDNREEKEDTEKTPEENDGDQQEETGQDQQPGYEELLERLDLIGMQEDSEETSGVTERLDALIQLLTPEETEDGIETYAAAFPFEGYEDWEYQIGVQYAVYPWGAGHWMEATETFYDPESFVARYDELISLCANGGTLKDFYVMYIWEDYTGDWETLVYDYQAITEPEPEPDPVEEEPDEAVELLLSHLESIDMTLAEMQQADLEYYQAVNDYQAEMLKINAAEAACTIVICVAVIAIFATLLWSELFRRFK